MHVQDANMHVTDVNMYVTDANMHVTDVNMHVTDVNMHVRVCDLQHLVSPHQPSLYLVPPHYRKPQYRNDITSRLSLSLDIVPFPLSLRLFFNSEVTSFSYSR